MRNWTKRTFAFLGAVVLLFGLIATLTGCNSSKKQCKNYEDAFYKIVELEYPDRDSSYTLKSFDIFCSESDCSGVICFADAFQSLGQSIIVSDLPLTQEDVRAWHERLPGGASQLVNAGIEIELRIKLDKIEDYEIKAELYKLFLDTYLQNHPEHQDKFN